MWCVLVPPLTYTTIDGSVPVPIVGGSFTGCRTVFVHHQGAGAITDGRRTIHNPYVGMIYLKFRDISFLRM